MITSIIPFSGVGNSLPLILDLAPQRASVFLAILCSLALDFVLRQKLQGQNLNLFIVEQLPAPPPEGFEKGTRGIQLGNLVSNAVLRLSYTSKHLEAFARDLGYEGPPFAWDDEERRHLMAQLDAVMFRLFGLGIEDADYVLSTFPIIREQDEAEFGRFRTRDLILAYMRAQAAGDFETHVSA